MENTITGIVDNIVDSVKFKEDQVKIHSRKDEITRAINGFLNEYDSNRKELIAVLKYRAENGKLNIIDSAGNIDIRKIESVISVENTRIEKHKSETIVEVGIEQKKSEDSRNAEEFFDNIIVNNLEEKLDKITEAYGIDTSKYDQAEKKVLAKTFDAINSFKKESIKIIEKYGGNATNPQCIQELEALKSTFQNYFRQINGNIAKNFDFSRDVDGNIIIKDGMIRTVADDVGEKIQNLSQERDSLITHGNLEKAKAYDDEIQALSMEYGYDKETMHAIVKEAKKNIYKPQQGFEDSMGPQKDYSHHIGPFEDFSHEYSTGEENKVIASQSIKSTYEIWDHFLHASFDNQENLVQDMNEVISKTGPYLEVDLENQDELVSFMLDFSSEDFQPITNKEGDQVVAEHGVELDDSGIIDLEKYDYKTSGIDTKEDDKMFVDNTYNPIMPEDDNKDITDIEAEEILTDSIKDINQEIEKAPEIEVEEQQNQLAVYKPRFADRFKSFVNDIKNMGLINSFSKNFMSNDVQMPVSETKANKEDGQLKGVVTQKQNNIAQEENVKKQTLLTKMKDSLKKAFGVKDETAEKIVQDNEGKIETSDSKDSKGGFDFSSPDEELMAKTTAVGKEAGAKLNDNKDKKAMSTAKSGIEIEERDD